MPRSEAPHAFWFSQRALTVHRVSVKNQLHIFFRMIREILLEDTKILIDARSNIQKKNVEDKDRALLKSSVTHP